MARKKVALKEEGKSIRRFTIVQALAYAAHSGGVVADSPDYATPDLELLMSELSDGHNRNPSHIEDMLTHFVKTGEILPIEHFRKLQAAEMGEDGNPVDEHGDPFSEVKGANDKPISEYTRDRVLALMNGADGFRHSRLVNESYGHTDFKSSNAGAVKRKLNDPSLYIAQIDVHQHDHPLSVDWNLQPGDILVEVDFCKVDKMVLTPVSFFRWFVQADVPNPPERASRAQSKAIK